MHRYTKILFYSSIILSLLSFFFIKKGLGEFYPFYSWKLFTKPSGSEAEEFEYRIYAIKNKDTIRLENTKSYYFDENDKSKIINSYGDLIFYGKDVLVNKNKLLKFSKFIEPSYNRFILVKEYYRPIELGASNSAIIKKEKVSLP